MPISVTAEQVLALAPDPASAKSARELATPRPWSQLGRDERAIWGACQGSGKNPYLTQVDWAGPAFKCSCPSRKFPCKHGLGLLLLLAGQPKTFTGSEQPEWVATWIASREKRNEAKAEAAQKPVDEAAREQRAGKRAERITEGLEQLELWLADLLQQGLATAPSRPFEFWEQPAARLIDAQAPGAARRVRELATLASSGDGWQHRLLDGVGRLALLLNAYRRRDHFEAPTQADILTAVGIATPQADVLALEPVRDVWFVAGQRVEQEDRLRVQRTWLLGAHTGRAALLLDFAPGAAGFANTLLPGTSLAAELCYFPSGAPLRALLKSSNAAASTRPAAASVAETQAAFAGRLALNPFLETQPAYLRDVVPVPGATWFLREVTSGLALPCRADFTMLALSGGHAIEVFGEWDQGKVTPLLAWSAGRVATLRQEAA
jgi:hypothetical protein